MLCPSDTYSRVGMFELGPNCNPDQIDGAEAVQQENDAVAIALWRIVGSVSVTHDYNPNGLLLASSALPVISMGRISYAGFLERWRTKHEIGQVSRRALRYDGRFQGDLKARDRHACIWLGLTIL
jgi:hypothetical protein